MWLRHTCSNVAMTIILITSTFLKKTTGYCCNKSQLTRRPLCFRSLTYHKNSTFFYHNNHPLNISRYLLFTNTFNFSLVLYNVTLPPEVHHVFSVSMTQCFGFFSSHEHKVLRVSFCDSPLSVVRQCVRQCIIFFIQTTFSLKPFIRFWPNFTGMIPGWSLTKVVQTIPVGCLSRSRGNRFSKCNFQKSSCLNLQGPELSYLVYSII